MRVKLVTRPRSRAGARDGQEDRDLDRCGERALRRVITQNSGVSGLLRHAQVTERATAPSVPRCVGAASSDELSEPFGGLRGVSCAACGRAWRARRSRARSKDSPFEAGTFGLSSARTPSSSLIGEISCLRVRRGRRGHSNGRPRASAPAHRQDVQDLQVPLRSSRGEVASDEPLEAPREERDRAEEDTADDEVA